MCKFLHCRSLLLFALILAVVLFACKKEEASLPDKTPKPSTSFTPESPKNQQLNFLCAGINQNLWFPLKVNTKWFFLPSSNEATYTVVDSTLVEGITRYKVIMNYWTPPSRGQNQANYVALTLYYFYNNDGDLIVEYENIGSYIDLKSNPYVGQEWFLNSDQRTLRRVVSLDEVVVTDSCKYENCLKIEHYETIDSNLVHRYDYLYKKGIGLVSIRALGTDSSIYIQELSYFRSFP